MAGVGYGLTPMSRLSQHSTRRRPKTGKPSDSSSPNSLSKKKTPKRKTLSSRYTAVLPSKRRKLGLSTITDPVDLLGGAHQTSEARRVVVSPTACNASETFSKDKEVRPRGRARGAKAKAGLRARVNARVKSRAKSIGLKSEARPVAQVLESKEAPKDEANSLSAVKDSFPVNATTEVASLSDCKHAGASTPSLLEEVKSKVALVSLETKDCRALLLARDNDSETAHAEPKQITERFVQVSKRGPGRKSSKRLSTLQTSGSGLRAAKDHEAAQSNNENEPPILVGSQVQESLITVDSGSVCKQDPSALEGTFLRPRRKAKESSLDEHRLPPWDYVGKRVVVYWPHAKAWYAGKVITYDDTSKKHKIKYDDSDEECISFRRHKVILEKPLSTQSAGEVTDTRILSARRKQFSAEDVAPHKLLRGDHVEDKCTVEDNALLSAFAPRHRVRESSYEPLCNGSVMLPSAFKGLDASPKKNTTALKSSKKSLSLVSQESSGRPAVGEKGNGGSDEAFVYVRRTKGRRKVDATPANKALDEILDEPNVSSVVFQQDTSRKRKFSQSFLRQRAEPEFPDCKFYENESSVSDAPDNCGTNGGGSNTSERFSRKRNKRSLKKLVSEASALLGTEMTQVAELGQDQMRKQRAKRTRRKLARKERLKNAVLSARKRRPPTKRVLCLADGVDMLGVEGDSSNLHHDSAKLYDFEISGNDMLMHESCFPSVSTIHLVVPAVMPDLFTWQLFSILKCSHFCGGGSFDELFSSNVSKRDWMGMFRILLTIVKAVPFGVYKNGRQWQCIILHELWYAMSRSGSVYMDTRLSLPPEVDRLVLEHLLGAVVSCAMTSRAFLNLFICYFIKPYIFATLCEKGMSIQVAVQQFLLPVRSKGRGTTCLRQSVERFPLQPSSGSADRSFASYMMLFPRLTDWCSEGGLFLKQLEEWITTTRHTGCAESWIPLTAIKKLDYLVWKVTSIRLVNGAYTKEELEDTLFRLEEENTVSGFLHELHSSCLRHVNVGGCSLDQKDGGPSGSGDYLCLNSALLLTASLQKKLNEAVRNGSGSPDSGKGHPMAVSLPFSKASAAQEQSFAVDQTKLIGRSGSVMQDTSVLKISAALSKCVSRENIIDLPCFSKSSSLVSNVPTKPIKMEPDMIFSRRDSSITTESNGTAIKEESSVEMCVRQQPLSSFLFEPDLDGQNHDALRLKPDKEHFSGQIDQDYYDNRFSKDVKMVKKSRPRHRSERQRPPHSKERPTFYCIADLVCFSNGNIERDARARVELHSRADSSFLIVVHVDERSFEQKIVEGGVLAKNPSERAWKSGSGWALEFPDTEQWELFRCMYNELSLQGSKATCVKEIPIPGVKEVALSDGDSQPRSCLRPFFAIETPAEEIDAAFATGRILYDLDSEDESWMAETNRLNRESGIESISDDILEQLIDRLEKLAYQRGEVALAVHDAIEFCQGFAGADTVQAVHTYWSNKRLAKGKSLLRYFQPPLWEQYQDELQAWETRMEQYSPEAKTMLLDRYPRPIMSAFCLQSRSLESLDTGKKMLKQKVLKKFGSMSRSSSEDSHPASARRRTNQLERARRRSRSSVGVHLLLDYDQEDEGIPESAKLARERAVEARRVAEARTLKLQRRFLQFDLSLQRAWAYLIEYAVSGGDASTESEAFNGRMASLFTCCSSLLSRGDDSSEDEPPSYSEQVCRDVGDEFLEAFAKKCSLSGRAVSCKGRDKAVDHDSEEASPLLPVFVKGSSYVWNGSSLLE